MNRRFSQWFAQWYDQGSDRPSKQADPDGLCHYPGCVEKGFHRAPKSRAHIEKGVTDDWYWFCLEHVREYNANWSYYAGMNEEEITKERIRDVSWQRPSWPLGERGGGRENAAAFSFTDPFGFFEGKATLERTVDKETQELQALKLLGLSKPYTKDQLQKAYYDKMKKHHPDRGGCVEEARRINEAYTYLRGLTRIS